MTIHLDPEQERIVELAIQAGLIRNVDDVVMAGLDSIRSRLEAHSGLDAETDSTRWTKELRDWIRSHSTSSPLLSDDAISRDSIYERRDV